MASANTSNTPSVTNGIEFFRCDPVAFHFQPEKYAEAQRLVQAELNLIIRKDWMHLIQLWFQSSIGAKYKDVLINANTSLLRFGNTARANDNTWTAVGPSIYEVRDYPGVVAGTGAGSTTGAELDAVDEAITKSLLYVIAACSGFYRGDGVIDPIGKQYNNNTPTLETSVSGGIRNLFQALLAAQLSGAQNELIIDQQKVINDLSMDAAGNAPGTLIAQINGVQTIDTDERTTIPPQYTAHPFGVDSATHTGTNNAAVIALIDTLWPNVSTDLDVTLASAPAAVPSSMNDPTNTTTSINGRTPTLSQILNAEAFLPVLNRLIHGGNFFVEFNDGNSAYPAADATKGSTTALQQAFDRKFATNRQFRKQASDGQLLLYNDPPYFHADASRVNTRFDTAPGDGSGDVTPRIKYDTELVFPIQMNVADVNSYVDNTGVATTIDSTSNSDQDNLNYSGGLGAAAPVSSQTVAGQGATNQSTADLRNFNASPGGIITGFTNLSGTTDANRKSGIYSYKSYSTSGNGVGATLSIHVDQTGTVTNVDIIQGGVKFAAGDTLTFDAAKTGGSGVITGVSVTNTLTGTTEGVFTGIVGTINSGGFLGTHYGDGDGQLFDIAIDAAGAATVTIRNGGYGFTTSGTATTIVVDHSLVGATGGSLTLTVSSVSASVASDLVLTVGSVVDIVDETTGEATQTGTTNAINQTYNTSTSIRFNWNIRFKAVNT